MYGMRALLVACLIAAAPSAMSTPEVAGTRDGRRDFDFERGAWRVHHRILRAGTWIEFDGTCTNRALMDGLMNVEEHVFERPTGTTRGVALRAYDPRSATWAIWWVDSRDPHGAIDPPVKGSFADGVGRFYSDGTVDGKPVRTRFEWSRITATSARWEQAYSHDAGATWETNWIMEFERAADR
jgi:hypothetical protein